MEGKAQRSPVKVSKEGNAQRPQDPSRFTEIRKKNGAIANRILFGLVCLTFDAFENSLFGCNARSVQWSVQASFKIRNSP